MDKAIEFLDQLSLKLNITGQDIFSALIERMYWNSVMWLVVECLYILISPFVIIRLWKSGIKNYNEQCNDAECTFCFVLVVVLAIILSIFAFDIPMNIVNLLSVKGAVINDILNILKQK